MHRISLAVGSFADVNRLRNGAVISSVRTPVIMLLGLIMAGCLGFPSTSRAAGASFVDDFSRPSDAWRFGNAVLSDGGNGLLLNASHPEVTLVGTALNPENLRTFTATLKWSFGGSGSSALLVGWGKPREWSGLDECPLHLSISRAGLVTVVAGKQTLGTAQLAAPKGDVYQVTFTTDPQRVVLRSARGEVSLPLPAGFAARAGYLMLRLEGLSGQHDEEWLRLRRVEINHSGQHAPLTPEERNREIQIWAKERLDKNWVTLSRFRTRIKAETDAGRWGYKTNLTVRPGLIKTGEKVTIEFRVAGPIPAPCTARVEADFLKRESRRARNLIAPLEALQQG